jgi:translocation and assembly module TamB
MTPGSIATYRSHDFLLTHAVVDLVERRRIRAQLDVHGEAQVRDYKVLVHAFGPTEDLQVQLTSQPSLTQEDIVTLLSLGVTSRDTAATGGMGGAATAAVGQALFSASGLDEQVKRWLPRGGVVRDFTMRITSAYSESSGQVVPKAEFESKLGEDFRLRYQAPISGGTQGKGQRAELEWRIDPRSRVQPALQLVWDNDNPDVATNIGGDVRFRLEWSD